MKLKDLLISYNQVLYEPQPFSEPEQYEGPMNELWTSPSYERLMKYTGNSVEQPEKVIEKEDLPHFEGWTYTPISVNPDLKQHKKYRASLQGSGYKAFQKALNDYIDQSGDFMSEKKKQDLAKIAYLESNFDPTAQNPKSSAYGFFQIIAENRDKVYDFKENINSQFRVASKLYDDNLRYISNYKDKIAEKNLSDFQAIYSWWWYPAVIKKYLESGDATKTDAQGTDLKKILVKAASV